MPFLKTNGLGVLLEQVKDLALVDINDPAAELTMYQLRGRLGVDQVRLQWTLVVQTPDDLGGLTEPADLAQRKVGC